MQTRETLVQALSTQYQRATLKVILQKPCCVKGRDSHNSHQFCLSVKTATFLSFSNVLPLLSCFALCKILFSYLFRHILAMFCIFGRFQSFTARKLYARCLYNLSSLHIKLLIQSRMTNRTFISNDQHSRQHCSL